MGGSQQAGNPDTQAILMQMHGQNSPIPPSGFGEFGQEKMREMLRTLMAKNPGDPLPFGLPPTPIKDQNNTLLASYGQNSALTPPGNKPPARRNNVFPLSI